MATKRGFLLFLLLLFVGLTLAFLIPYRQLIEDNIAAPLADFLRYIQKIWKSLDGDLVWAFFILIVYVFILMTLPTTRNFPQRPSQEKRIHHENRLDFWRYQVRRFVNAHELSRLSVVELRKLVLDVIAFREELDSRKEAEHWLMTHDQHVPSEVVSLFDRKISSGTERTGRSAIPVWRRFWPWKKARLAPQHQSEEKLRAILQFLENQFESPHDYYR